MICLCRVHGSQKAEAMITVVRKHSHLEGHFLLIHTTVLKGCGWEEKLTNSNAGVNSAHQGGIVLFLSCLVG